MLPSHPEPEQRPETVFSNPKELEVGKKKTKQSLVWDSNQEKENTPQKQDGGLAVHIPETYSLIGDWL